MGAKVLFMNGDFLPFEQGTISVRTHGFAYGTGCFEGIRGYWNAEDQQIYLFRLREHFERLERSCKILQMSLPYTVDEFIEISTELVRRNGQREDVYLRPVIYKSDQIIGVRLHGLKDDCIITSEPLGNYIEITGLRCGVSSWRRIDDNAIPARAKVCGGYVNAALAKSEALQNGFDEAIMLTNEGHVSEGSAENIFLYLDGELVTPAPSENILLGITRDTVIQVAQRELGIPTRERVVDRTELYNADEVFLCGTGAQIAPVIEIDRRPIGTGNVGPIATRLQELYFDIVRGKRAEYRKWCTPVYSLVSAENTD
ncbi:branched-chain amino acid aminotransferase [Thermosporothrix hazakensis]|jgi:branched-chain amino acid aminotransferase|uniref:Branched-chain-amino-acid aminotransferase n=2 Tax=Thermosporothrix TaxID=768650 RepID=A0A326TZW5_THEHA|nr:branched-chain amino acid transaminase [Thermosporothrix hazakensis]PZW23304.1 branched-chain amino acid aminotransferase [Thermosporothrix hazakensis]BBH89583.1 branched chain amino acid aminotransferase [Thermosporothrix sp. COM3]GCE47769.1 branched chain amino acid aminotransferase [Thermosporothrix hazakensis]